jgi:hypothetical protein
MVAELLRRFLQNMQQTPAMAAVLWLPDRSICGWRLMRLIAKRY